MTPGDDEDSNPPRVGTDLYGMRRRYTTAFDSEDTDFTASLSNGGGGGRGRDGTALPAGPALPSLPAPPLHTAGSEAPADGGGGGL